MASPREIKKTHINMETMANLIGISIFSAIVSHVAYRIAKDEVGLSEKISNLIGVVFGAAMLAALLLNQSI